VTTAVMLGGPNHGKVYHLQNGADTINFATMPDPSRYFLGFDSGELITVSCPTIKLPIFHREIAAVLHPQYSRDTGKRMLADLVMRAWSRYDVSSDRTERGK
jgi:hypothetical protein